MFVIGAGLAIPYAELEFNYVRSSGPGGQNVNKVNSKVQLRWHCAANSTLPQRVLVRLRERLARRITHEGDLLLSSQRFRDRGRNTADVLQKLQAFVLSAAEVEKPRVPTKPTRGSRERRLRTKEKVARKKDSRRGSGWND